MYMRAHNIYIAIVHTYILLITSSNFEMNEMTRIYNLYTHNKYKIMIDETLYIYKLMTL